MATIRAPRHASRSSAQDGRRETRPLADWGALDAYVLLGDPGAGKSWAFEDECQNVAGVLLQARDVVAGIAPTGVAGRTVFIDGLDEVRAGATDGRVPFDAIRKWLHDHGNPRLRLSCREADWRGSNDTDRLAQVAPGGQVAELHLDPLRDADIAAILGGRTDEVPDAQAFLKQAEQAGLTDLLRNPLLLDLTIASATHGVLPGTRTGIYDAACSQLAREYNAEHRVAHPAAHTDHRLLRHAGRLCALLLLSGKRGISRSGTPGRDAVVLADLPEPWGDAAAAAKSKLFQAEGDLQVPRHRSIAEFLGGRALAECIKEGLPLGRVLALMQGIDGFPVEPLRGLWAWLAVHHAPSRERLIATDPLGFVLNGDAAALSASERLHVLQALQVTAEKDPWFRREAWVSHPFGSLATADMASAYDAVLRDPRRDRGHLSFIDCVFDALRHGERMPSLASALESWVEDGRAPSELRLTAYMAWKKHCDGPPAQRAMIWLQAIEAGTLVDSEDELLGALLTDVYPTHLPPTQVFDHWHRPKRHDHIGRYWAFWTSHLLKQTPPQGFTELIGAWLQRRPTIKASDLDGATDVSGSLLSAGLEHAGDQVLDTTLYDWLGIGLDEHGFSRSEDQLRHIRAWLSARPERMKAVMTIGLSRTTPDAEVLWPFWRAELRLHGATRPRDWLFWLLDQASTAHTPQLAEFCFLPAADAAITPRLGLDSPSMAHIEAWVEAHKAKWPDAERWLEAAWSSDLKDWRGDEARRKRLARAQELERDDLRRRSLLAHLPSLLDGTAPPGLLHHVAIAHERGFSDLRGDTPLERVRHYLLSDEATAQAVIAALPRVLDRTDLPTVDEAFALEAKGRQHYVRPAALLAARQVHERDTQAPLAWPRALVERLVAYYLTDGTGEMPGWYRLLASRRADWVAPVLVQYARPKFKRKGDSVVAGLWALGSEADHSELARLALPLLLEAFPLRAGEPGRRTLNRCLLPALSTLDREQATRIVRLKLRQDGMDAAQRICWRVAELPYRAEAAQELAALVGRNERRAVILGVALDEQHTLARVAQRLPPDALRHLIEVLAPITSPDARERSGFVKDSDRRAHCVQALLSALSSNPEPSAREALLALAQAPGMPAWKDKLQYNVRNQAAATREASFQMPNPAAVAHMLDGAAPANPADLRALVVQHLCELQDEWRGIDTFALGLFWRDTPRAPKTENDCRDLLLDRLRARLRPLDILVGREHSAAQDKRADMCAEFMRNGRRIALPIEVEKEDNARLWTAWRDQLQRPYTIDPAAQGFGLYLVLWFGGKLATHPEGLKPRDHEQLREAIEARIPMADRHRLAVQVLDLSWPADAQVHQAGARSAAR